VEAASGESSARLLLSGTTSGIWLCGGTTHPKDSKMTKRSENLLPPARPAIIEKDLSYKIFGCGLQTWKELGYGFVESIYSRALEILLTEAGLLVEREVPVDVVFRGRVVGKHRLDMRVERRVILEIKSTERLADVAKKQLRSYLKATNLELGLVLHFGLQLNCERVLGPRSSA
jgi:GxxExxY protein